MGQANAASNAQAGQLSRTQDLNSYLNDTQKNTSAGDQSTVGAFGRMNNIFGSENELNQLPQERALSQAGVQDKQNENWQTYQNEQTPFENLIGSAVGILGGKLLGSKIFGKTKNPNDPTGVEEEDDFQPPQVS
jgi:hypothetical protein